MRRERFTIVHTHTPKAGLLGQLAARLAGVPIVVNTVHGFYFHEHMSARARRFYIAMEKIAAWCSHLILSQNAEDIQTALKGGICTEGKIKLLGNGIDLTEFDPSMDCGEVRQRVCEPSVSQPERLQQASPGQRPGFHATTDVSPERAQQSDESLMSRPFRADAESNANPGRCPGLAYGSLSGCDGVADYKGRSIADYTHSPDIPLDAMVVGFVGRLAGRRKGFLDFLAAAKQIAAQLPQARFLIVGDADSGKPDAVEPSAAADYGIADRCVFLGHRPNAELPPLYKLMNVLVLPSLFEGVPRVVMEASAMGVPCVVSNVKGNREAVSDDRNGLLVPFGDVPALVAAITRILTEPATAQRMSLEARRMAVERFDERIVFEKVKAEYARLLREKGCVLPSRTDSQLQCRA